MTECSVAGEKLVLLPEKVAYWPAQKALFVADFHLGKVASFRSAGIPLPSGTTTENVERLGRAIAKTGAAHVVFLGDFLHHAHGPPRGTLGRFWPGAEPRQGLGTTHGPGDHGERAA